MRLALIAVFTALFATSCAGGDTKLKCTANEDCHSDPTGIVYACDSVEQVCLRACTDDSTCLASQHCDTAHGVCRDGTPGGGDPGAGDPGAGDPGGDPGAGDPGGDPGAGD